jgi:hypothetical protein
LGGAIGVHSRPGEGATFWFRLPAASAGETPDVTPPVPDDAPGRAPRGDSGGSAVGSRSEGP